MTKRNFKPPGLQHRNKWSETFHEFLKFALQKEPRNRPVAAELLKVKYNYYWGSVVVDMLQDGRAIQMCLGEYQRLIEKEGPPHNPPPPHPGRLRNIVHVHLARYTQSAQ
jgi:hypothetical protein